METIQGKKHTLECELTEKIEDLKAKIDAKEGFKTTSLIFANRQLEDGKTLLDYKIEPGSTVDLLRRLMG